MNKSIEHIHLVAQAICEIVGITDALPKLNSSNFEQVKINDNGTNSIWWSAENFLFILSTDGHWCAEQRDGTKNGTCMHPTDFHWVIELVESHGCPVADAVRCVYEWRGVSQLKEGFYE